MWNSLTCIIWLILSSISFSTERYGQDIHKEEVFVYTTDRDVEVRVFIVSLDGQPSYYESRLNTPICMDNLCNPIEILIQWDLLGNFRQYIETGDKPLTKFDHQDLEEIDHILLRNILKDKESLLQDYAITDLVDSTDLVYSAEIDAMTGATSKSFANEVVSGAIYTCYTLWHFVNGELDDRILDHTLSILNLPLKKFLLTSDFVVYQSFVLNHISKGNWSECKNEIRDLVYSQNDYLALDALSLMNKNEDAMINLSELFKDVDSFSLPIKNALLSMIKVQELPKSLLIDLIEYLPNSTENQRKVIYDILEFNAKKIDLETKRIVLEKLHLNQRKLQGRDYQLIDKLELH